MIHSNCKSFMCFLRNWTHELIEKKLLDKDYYAAVNDYNYAVLHGIVKIASKMGISTIQSYQGSKIFEALKLIADSSSSTQCVYCLNNS